MALRRGKRNLKLQVSEEAPVAVYAKQSVNLFLLTLVRYRDNVAMHHILTYNFVYYISIFKN